MLPADYGGGSAARLNVRRGNLPKDTDRHLQHRWIPLSMSFEVEEDHIL